MYKIDKSVLDTQSKILFNISEQLQEIITLLKPQEVKEVIQQETRLYKCKKCGQEFDKSQKLAVHSKKCRE